MSQQTGRIMTNSEKGARAFVRKVELALAYSAGVLTIMVLLAIEGAFF